MGEINIYAFKELISRLCLPDEVARRVLAFQGEYRHEEALPHWQKLFSPAQWEQGVLELTQYFGEDLDGIKMLTCQLNCLLYTQKMYSERGIPQRIFDDTMQFIPRFLERYKRIYGCYRYVWGWWFPRQLSLHEFRIGALEYALCMSSVSAHSNTNCA